MGKSTAVRQTLSKLPSPKGAVHVMVPQTGADAFVNELVAAVKYRYPLDMFVWVRSWATDTTMDKSPDQCKGLSRPHAC